MKTIKMNELSNWLVIYITDFIHGAQAENAQSSPSGLNLLKERRLNLS